MASRALSLVKDTGRDVARVKSNDVEDIGFELADLVARFEESEDSSQEARQESELYQEFYDGDQLSEEERAALRKRKQPEVETNLIKPKVDFLVGLEKQQRTKPKALPRTPKHEQDAEACSDALNYVVEDQDFKMVRSSVWKDMLVPGTGGVEVIVKDYKSGTYDDPNEICIEIKHYRWDRLFIDPHSFASDCTDAGYYGAVLWMDYADAVAMFPDKKEELRETIESGASSSDTYDDKPISTIWADRKRKRVRIVKMWIKRGEDWFDYTFTKGGILNGGKSPYVTDDGYSDDGMVLQSAYVSKDGKRYGIVKQFLSPQREYNKRSSKALHLLNTSKIVFEDGAINDVERARTEYARPDGTIKVAQDALAEKRVEFIDGVQLAAGHVKMMEIAREAIQMMGPNAAMQGDGSEDASGRAILASQQGGMIELGSLLDDLRHFDRRVYRKIWNRIRQYWTGQRWIRITDDQRNMRFAAINQPAMVPVQIPGTGEQIQIPDIDPRTGQQRVQNNTAEADVDIYIDDVSDTVAPQIEQWQALVELKKVDVNNELPFDVLIKAAPNIRNKDEILEGLEQRRQAMAQQMAGPTPEQIALDAKAKELEMTRQAKAEDHQQQIVQNEQTHRQKLIQSEQEHRQQLALDEQKAQVQERIQMRQAQLQEHTKARMAEMDSANQQRKAEGDLVNEAKRSEIANFYEGKKTEAALKADSERENLKNRAESDRMEARKKDADEARKADVASAKEKAKASKPDTSGLEKKFDQLLKAVSGLADSIGKANDETRSHRQAVGKELERLRAARKGN